ncbi:MAG: hypothetical protein ACRDJH_05360 [Thermomicrobiales bacterium]
MDDCRFDDLTRALARGRSRRQVLAGLVGGMAAGLTALRGADVGARAARNQPAGSPCTRLTECASLHCVDGVCCDTACTGQCESCATGACSPVSGAPAGKRPACPGSGDCAATCDGTTRNACTFLGSETVCAEPACADGVQTAFTCAGNGTCHPTTTSCGLFVCGDEGACLTTCVSDEDCVGEAFCADGICAGDKGLGELCANDASCQSGLCVDGVCCDGVCGDCEACNLPSSEGTCTPVADGATCGADSSCCGGACCASGQECIDGACQVPACLPPASFCSTADQCCQDEPTVCEDVPRCGDSAEGRCCRPVGSSCIAFSCECCGFSDCIDGVCVETCSGFGFECFVDDHCCDDLVCRDNTCREASSICLALSEICTSADQCCQDAPTLCEVIPQSAINDPQCCRARGGACTNRFTDCCGSDECIDGVCVAGCFGVGIECFVADHCCGGHCLNGICRDEACLAPGNFCSTADECCQDERTFCEDVPRCGDIGEDRCCRPVGGSCTGNNCACCGAATCQDGMCVDACIDFGLECFLDDHCCSGECDAGVCAQN